MRFGQLSSNHTRIAGAISACAVAVTLYGPRSANAASITSLAPDIGVTSVPTASLGSQGYIFYGAGGNNPGIYTGTASSPVSYVSLNPGGSPFGDPSYEDLTIGGTSTYTGVEYTSNSAPGSPTVIDTITLTQTGVNGSSTTGALVSPFVVGVLEDNAADPSSNDMASVTLTLSAGSSGTSDSASLLQNVAGDGTIGSPQLSNDFYLYTISGAHVGDQITVAPTNDTGGNIVIGGLTFDASTPEPTSIGAMLVVGGAALLRRRRLARS